MRAALTLSPERQSAQMSKLQNDRPNPVWHRNDRMLYSCYGKGLTG